MFDGSRVTFEMLKRPYNGCVIPVVGDKIMVLEQEQPGKPLFLSLPGGRCETNEAPIEAAKRELIEETGYSSNDWELWIQSIPEEKVDWQIHTYVARNCMLTNQPVQDHGEKIRTKLISLEEFLLLSDNPIFRNKDAVTELLRVRLDSVKRDAFAALLFGKR